MRARATERAPLATPPGRAAPGKEGYSALGDLQGQPGFSFGLRPSPWPSSGLPPAPGCSSGRLVFNFSEASTTQERTDSMKSLVARYLRFVAVVCSVMLVALTVGCETEPEPVVSLTGTWTGLQDSAMDDRTLRWQLALVDLPPDSIWGSARWQIADAGPGWSPAEYLTGWRDGSSVVLEWGYRGQVKTRYEAEVPKEHGGRCPGFHDGQPVPYVV